MRRAIISNIDIDRLKVVESRRRMKQNILHNIQSALTQIEHLRAQIRALSPAATMDRGYAIVLNSQGEIVRNDNQVQSMEIIDVRVAHGQFRAQRVE